MSNERLFLDGEKYSGRFVAFRHTEQKGNVISSESYFWKGAGVISDIRSPEDIFFGFQTNSFDVISCGWIDGEYTLEETLIYWKQREREGVNMGEYGGGLEVAEDKYSQIVDLSLGLIFERAKESRLDIPYFNGHESVLTPYFNPKDFLYLPCLDKEILEKSGLLIPKVNGAQIILPLGVTA